MTPRPHGMNQSTTPSHDTAAQRWRRLLLVGHLVVSVGLIGAALVLVALGISGVRGADPLSVYPPAHEVEIRVVTPLALLALGTGVAQAMLTGRGLLHHRWVTVKLTITTAATAAIIFVLRPRLADSSAAAALGESFTTGEQLPLVIAPAVAVSLLAVNVVLGVFKPGERSHSQTVESG